ncbi:TESPA1-like [Homarus americanus]|uniref:TESPA1-like n=1 Tax=Homarus americanus TaxID=6706 RepID=A0A8J5MXD3_HOMAM|nr:TESPA1-like [Homarus americanus]
MAVEEDGETWGPVEVIGGDEDMLYLGAEESLVTSSVTTTGAARLSRADASVTASVTIAGAATSTASQPASAISVTEDAAASLMGGRLHHPPSSFYQPSQIDGATAVFTRPLTLTDVEITLQEQQADKMGVEGRRSQFASLREKQSSFQSELSGLSFHSNYNQMKKHTVQLSIRSSIDSLLESRQADPVEVLLSLGFGGHAQDGISRIPERFLRPSQVPGNDIDEFMRSEDEISEMMETAEMMPGIDPQGLTMMRGGLSPRGRRRYRRRYYLRPQSPQPSIRSAPPSLQHYSKSRFLTVQRDGHAQAPSQSFLYDYF